MQEENTQQTRFKVIIEAPRKDATEHAENMSGTAYFDAVDIFVPEENDLEVKDIQINENETIVIFDLSSNSQKPKKDILYYAFLFAYTGGFTFPTKTQRPEPIKINQGEFYVVTCPTEELLLHFQYGIGYLRIGLPYKFPYVLHSALGFHTHKRFGGGPAYYSIEDWVKYLGSEISELATTLEQFKSKFGIK